MRRLLVCLALAACSAEEAGEPTPEAVEASAEGPEAVVEAYYDALARQDYDTAWQLWGKEPAAHPKEFAAFVKGFEDTVLATAELGDPSEPRRIGRYMQVEVPVRVEDLKGDGSGNSYAGSYTLRQPVEEDDAWFINEGDLAIID